jgi:hypothetical protein
LARPLALKFRDAAQGERGLHVMLRARHDACLPTRAGRGVSFAQHAPGAIFQKEFPVTRPLVAEDPLLKQRARPAVYLFRAAACHVRGAATRTSVEATAKSLFGHDPVTTMLLQRAATGPATIGNAAWAGAIAGQAVFDAVAEITSLSAGAELIQRGIKLDMTGIWDMRIPGRVVDPNAAGQWLAEISAIPVQALNFTAGPTMQPRKFATIAVFTREIVESSNIVALTQAILSEAAALKIDSALFSTDADDGIKPGGILNGIAPLTGTAGGGQAAMIGDIKQLTSALVAAGAGKNPLIIASPVQAMTLKLYPTTHFPDVLSSTSLAAGTIIMLEPSSFISGFSSVPQFSTSKGALLHMDDAPNADPLVGGPSRSLYQTDSQALKMLVEACWALRAPHIAWVQAATW